MRMTRDEAAEAFARAQAQFLLFQEAHRDQCVALQNFRTLAEERQREQEARMDEFGARLREFAGAVESRMREQDARLKTALEELDREREARRNIQSRLEVATLALEQERHGRLRPRGGARRRRQ